MSARGRRPEEERAVSFYRRVVEAAFPRSADPELIRETVRLFAEMRSDAERSRRAGAAWSYTLRASIRALWDGAAMRAAELGDAVGGVSFDVRYALRQMRRRPLVALVAVLSLAVGMAANTILFSAVNGLLLDPLPVPAPDRIVRIFGPEARTTLASALSPTALDRLDRESTALEGAAGVVAFRAGVEFGDRSLLLGGELVTPNFFDVMGVAPARGRSFRPAEGEVGGGRVVVLSHDLHRQWSEDGGEVVGSSIRLNRELFTVVGVAPPGFGGTNIARPVDLWVPTGARSVVGAGPAEATGHDPWLRGIGRLRPGAGREEASAQVDRIMARLHDEHPDRYAEAGYFVLGERAGLINPARPELVPAAAAAALGAGLLVLLIVCLNVGGLVLVRAAARREELGVRMALGAGRGRIVRQTLVEGAVLVVPAVVAALWAAAGSEPVLTALLPVLRRMSVDFSVDGAVVGFVLATGVLAALVSAIGPAVFAGRQSVAALMGSRGDVGGGPRRLLNGLAGVQVAVAVAVLLMAGLFVRTLEWYRNADPGYGVADRVAVTVDVGLHGLDESEGRVFFDELVRRARALPGVGDAALARGITRGGPTLRIRPTDGGEPVRVETNVIGPGYFDVMGIAVVEGRAFTTDDRRDAEPVAVVNETLARRLWGVESAVGRALPVLGAGGSVTAYRVVGVAREIQYGSLAEGPRAFAYLPALQRFSERMTLLAAGDPEEVVPPVRRLVGDLAPGLPIVEATTVEAFVDEDRLLARAAATVGGVLGGLALILAALGIYGTVAFSVQRRRPELGVRLAMGAAPGRIFRQVIARGLLLYGAAGLAGLAVGLGAAALIDDLLVGTSAADPVALLGAPALLGLIVTLAMLGPARQAAALDPVEALREE